MNAFLALVLSLTAVSDDGKPLCPPDSRLDAVPQPLWDMLTLALVVSKEELPPSDWTHPGALWSVAKLNAVTGWHDSISGWTGRWQEYSRGIEWTRWQKGSLTRGAVEAYASHLPTKATCLDNAAFACRTGRPDAEDAWIQAAVVVDLAVGFAERRRALRQLFWLAGEEATLAWRVPRP